MSKLQPLLDEVNALKALLDAPEEGLMTWGKAVHKRWQAICNMYELGIPEYLKRKDARS